MSRHHRGRVRGAPLTRELPAPAGAVAIETFVPWEVVRRGMRKRFYTPKGEPLECPHEVIKERPVTNVTPLVRALALAHYWQKLLEEGRYVGLRNISEAEGVDAARASRIFRLTQLAPTVIEAAISGAPLATGLSDLMRWFPDTWEGQKKQIDPSQ